MNQDKKQDQMGKPQQGSQGEGKPQMNERGNPSTTERIQPDQGRSGGQRAEGDKPGKSEQSNQNNKF